MLGEESGMENRGMAPGKSGQRRRGNVEKQCALYTHYKVNGLHISIFQLYFALYRPSLTKSLNAVP